MLRDPLVVAAFRGWNDGGQAASLAATFLRDQIEAKPFCEIDPEEFYDFQEVRPHVALTEGMVRRIDWPENVFSQGALPGGDRDCVVLIGIERWLHRDTQPGVRRPTPGTTAIWHPLRSCQPARLRLARGG